MPPSAVILPVAINELHDSFLGFRELGDMVSFTVGHQ